MLHQGCNETWTDLSDGHDDACNTVMFRHALHTEMTCFDVQTHLAGMHANHNICTTACHVTGNVWLAINSLHAMAMTIEDPLKLGCSTHFHINVIMQCRSHASCELTCLSCKPANSGVVVTAEWSRTHLLVWQSFLPCTEPQ